MDALKIEWQLIVAQLFNFALMIVVLRLFLYEPVLKMLQARKRRRQGSRSGKSQGA
jgi:F0F1-type ATP synthase membrane subunit b/b'